MLARFLTVTISFAVLIAVAYALPSSLWASFDTLPVHPLIVHGVVVLVPLLSVCVLVSLFVRTFLALAHLWLIAGLGLVAVIAVGSQSSGNELASVVGLPEFHSQWGANLVVITVVLFGTFVAYSFVAVYRSAVVATRLIGLLAGLVAVVAIATTVVVGHSGAESVWAKIYAQPAAATQAPTVSASATAAAATEPAASQTPTPESAAPAGITLAEVSSHNTAEDCWTVVGESVYDLTSFVSRHPGGSGVISQLCGREASESFLAQHGGQAEPTDQLESLKIGAFAR